MSEITNAKPTWQERVLNQAEEAARNAASDVQGIPTTDEEGGYRVSRSSVQEETSSAAVNEPKAETASPEESAEGSAEGRRRHRRATRREDDE